MSDVIAYSIATKSARSSAVILKIDAAASAGKLRLYAGARPAVTAAPPSSALAELMLAKPCGTVNAQAELVFSAVADAMVQVAGTATWARLVDGDGVTVADMDVGEAGSGAAVILGKAALDAGAIVRVTLAKIIEP